MRVDTERGKALERLSGSRCAADGNQLYPSRPLAVGLMIRSWGALQCMKLCSALLRSPHGLQQEGLRSVIGTAAATAMEKRNLAIDQWGGDKRNFQDVGHTSGTQWSGGSREDGRK